MATSRIANLLFFAAFAGVIVFSATLLYRNMQELQAMGRQDRVAEAKLEELMRKSEQRQLALNKLDSDRGYIEKTIRKKLGYSKEDETIFRFE